MGSFYISGNCEISYVHIPRTGLGMKKIIADYIKPSFTNFTEEEWMLNHPSLKMVKDKIPSGKTFSVIRNPWMRVWSLYRKIQTEGYWLDWNGLEKEVLKPFNEWLEDYCDPKYDFEFPRWFSRWTQMSEFVEYKDLNGKLYTVDFLLKSESLEQDFEQVRDYLQLTTPLPDISMHKETKEYRQYYTDKGAECVYKIYARDIIKYGYEF